MAGELSLRECGPEAAAVGAPGFVNPQRRVAGENAPGTDGMPLADILLKGAVVHERPVAEHGFAGNCHRVKTCLQEDRPRIPDGLGISPGRTGGSRKGLNEGPRPARSGSG